MKLKNVKVGMKVVVKETGDVVTVGCVEGVGYTGCLSVFVKGEKYVDWVHHDKIKPYKEPHKESPEIEVVESPTETQESKTPAQKLGYEIGDLFYCKCSNSSDEGVYEFWLDDGSDEPKFKLVDGVCGFTLCDDEKGRYFSLHTEVTPLPKYKDKRDALIGCEVVYVGDDYPSKDLKWAFDKPEVVTGHVVDVDEINTKSVLVNFGDKFKGHGGGYSRQQQPNTNNWFCTIDELKMVMEDGSVIDINLDDIQTLRPEN